MITLRMHATVMYMEDHTYNKSVLTNSWLNKVDTHRVLIGRRIVNAPVMNMKSWHHTAK